MMDTNQQLERLESAILQRAQVLAEAQQHAGQQQREKILADAAKRLRQQEERELATAQIAAERIYQRRVQASEIKMQAELDQLRWSLVQAVKVSLRERFKQLTQQQTIYQTLLKQYLTHAITLFDEEELVVEVNPSDYALLSPQWDDWMREIATTPLNPPLVRGERGGWCVLSTHSRSSIGGLLVHNKDNRIRVDNTFEGLIERLENELHQVIIAQLFAMATPLRNV
jgi:V/A-type H+-transporting ATPase subunit E